MGPKQSLILIFIIQKKMHKKKLKKDARNQLFSC